MIKIRNDYAFLELLFIPILIALIVSCLKKLFQRKNKKQIKKNREESYNNNLLQSQRNLEDNKNYRNKNIISNKDDKFEDYSPIESLKKSKNVLDYKSNSKKKLIIIPILLIIIIIIIITTI